MALEAPLRSSTGSITMASFSPHADIMSVSSPDSPALGSQPLRSSAGTDYQPQRPHSFIRPSSSHLMSPSSDIVGPSPVTSNGTETTEIEDDPIEDAARHPGDHISHSSLMMLKTNLPDHMRKLSGEEVVSVIHAPQGFDTWRTTDTSSRSSLTSTSLTTAVNGTISPPPSEPGAKSPPHRGPPMVDTNVKPVAFTIDTATPQAQNLQDILNDPSRLPRPGSAMNLAQIPESHETDDEEIDDEDIFDSRALMEEDSEIKALRTALEECWTLCNTLANLSSIHRERVFNSTGTPDAHERAWKSCWKLCKRLYLSRDDTSEQLNIRTNLDLCRDFCQSLFDVRQKQDEVSDSVLRVSFELNNHLYSAQDSRNLPEAFRERTLDFYITLCHRLMKQRSELVEETDSLLRACWSLAEMLFSLRQNRRDGKPEDEELLGSAVQACWELCDIFREGWTQIRPDRGTPRPNQVNFFSSSIGSAGLPSETSRSQAGSRSSVHSHPIRNLNDMPRKQQQAERIVPETPVTEFEDTPLSPDESSPQAPNIMVLGASTAGSERNSVGGGGGRWSSSASNLSSYSKSSAHTSSTVTTTAGGTNEDINITRIKLLVVKAAMNIGYDRNASEPPGSAGAANLQAFVKTLPTGSFGSLPAHATLLQNYKNLVLADSAFRASSAAGLPARGKRVSAFDVAKSVGWMTLRSSQYGFLKELFRLVFGFPLEDAESRRNVSIAV